MPPTTDSSPRPDLPGELQPSAADSLRNKPIHGYFEIVDLPSDAPGVDENILTCRVDAFGFPVVTQTIQTADDEITVRGPEDFVRELREAADRERHRRARWSRDYKVAMSELAKLFPSMHDVPGTDPWNVDLLISWMNGGGPTSGSWHAAMFLLGVWNPTTDWRECGLKTLKKNGPARFNFFRAMGSWDHQHIDAMKEWVNNPFWP